MASNQAIFCVALVAYLALGFAEALGSNPVAEELGPQQLFEVTMTRKKANHAQDPDFIDLNFKCFIPVEHENRATALRSCTFQANSYDLQDKLSSASSVNLSPRNFTADRRKAADFKRNKFCTLNLDSRRLGFVETRKNVMQFHCEVEYEYCGGVASTVTTNFDCSQSPTRKRFVSTAKTIKVYWDDDISYFNIFTSKSGYMVRASQSLDKTAEQAVSPQKTVYKVFMRDDCMRHCKPNSAIVDAFGLLANVTAKQGESPLNQHCRHVADVDEFTGINAETPSPNSWTCKQSENALEFSKFDGDLLAMFVSGKNSKANTF